MKQKKYFIITIFISILMCLFICNTSKASTLTNTDLKSAVEDYFLSYMEMYETVNDIHYNEDGSDFGSSLNFDLDNSKISTFNSKGNLTCEITYSFYPTFTNNEYGDQIQFYIKSYPKNIEEEGYSEKDINNFFMKRCFLCSTIGLGQKVSLAYTHFDQARKYNEDGGDSNLFAVAKNAIVGDEHYGQYQLHLYLDDMKFQSSFGYNKNISYYNVTFPHNSVQPAISLDLCKDKTQIEPKKYTGEFILPSVSLIDNDTLLVEGVDYKLSYVNNLNPGLATINITGIGKYKGKINKFFWILPKKVTGVTNKTQGQKDIVVKWDRIPGVTGYVLEKYDSSKKKYVQVAVTQKTSYKVTKLKTATTYKFRVKAYIYSEGEDGPILEGPYSSATKLTTKTKTPSISKVTSGKKKITVKYKKISGSNGYQIQYSTNKNFKKNNKSVNVSNKVSSKTIKGLKSKKRYYTRIRTFRTINGKKTYSSYSKVKIIKTK